MHAIVQRVGDGTVTAKLWGSQYVNEEVQMSYGSHKLYWIMEIDKEAIKDRGIVSDWSDHLLTSKDESLDKVATSQVITGLRMAYDVMHADDGETGRDRTKMLRLESKPYKKVFVVEDVEAGELTLVPFSNSVVVDDESEKRISDCVKCSEVFGRKNRNVWINAPTQTMPKFGTDNEKASLELFWCVQKVPVKKGQDEPEEVNMHLVDCRVLGALSVRIKGENKAGVAKFLLIC